eukprot:1598085-Prorocentrum_lima.AAC.1
MKGGVICTREHFLWQAATSEHDGAALKLRPSLALPRRILAFAATSEKHAMMLQFMRRVQEDAAEHGQAVRWR